MRKNEVMYDGELTGTLSEAKAKRAKLEKMTNHNEEFGEEFDPIQQMWRVNPAEEADYKGTKGFKDA